MVTRKALLRTTMLSGIAGAVYLSGNLARAADIARVPYGVDPSWYAPAVDGVTGKLAGVGGSFNHKSFGAAEGSLAFPLGGQWGVQIDGVGGSLDNRAFESVGGHLFWRNPWRGLLGVYTSYTSWDRFGGVHVTQAAGEVEAYWGRLTLQGIAGVEWGNSASTSYAATTVIAPAVGVPGAITTTVFTQSYDVKTRFMDQINLKYYVTDNWSAYVGHRYLGGKNALALGSEVGLPLGRVMGTAFVEARIASGSFEGVWGGLRFYFGQKNKTLIRRNREDDDPYTWGTNNPFSLLNSSNQSISQSSLGISPFTQQVCTKKCITY